jgi:hypothetical protein
MRRFESSRPSQAVGPIGNWPVRVTEKPANGGLLQFGEWSPDSHFDGVPSEIGESLRRFFEIFPFSEDGDWRLGSIYTAWSSLQWNSPNSPPEAGQLGISNSHCRAEVVVLFVKFHRLGRRRIENAEAALPRQDCSSLRFCRGRKQIENARPHCRAALVRSGFNVLAIVTDKLSLAELGL